MPKPGDDANNYSLKSLAGTCAEPPRCRGPASVSRPVREHWRTCNCEHYHPEKGENDETEHISATAVLLEHEVGLALLRLKGEFIASLSWVRSLGLKLGLLGLTPVIRSRGVCHVYAVKLRRAVKRRDSSVQCRRTRTAMQIRLSGGACRRDNCDKSQSERFESIGTAVPMQLIPSPRSAEPAAPIRYRSCADVE